jgi:hypothetical protein
MARAVAGGSGERPCWASKGGATKRQSDTDALAGFPGSMKTAMPDGPAVPKPCGMPGCMATSRKVFVPRFCMGSLDDILLAAHAHPAAGDQHAGARHRLVDRGRPMLIVPDDPMAARQAA